MTTRLFVLTLLLFASLSGLAQDAKESLGPKDMPEASGKTANPIAELMKTVRWQVRPELQGKHPRVFFTAEELAALRLRSRTTHRALWTEVVRDVRALKVEPPPAPSQARRSQNTVAINLAQAAFVYSIEKDPKYLAAAKKYMDAALTYDVWGYSYSKPNVDLAAGHLLYGLGWAYDLLYHDLTPAERAKYKAKLIRQGELLYAFYQPKPGRSYSYSQNHLFIPIAGLAVAGYALQGEAPEAEKWSRLSRALYDRVLATYSSDGYYYEGVEYWVFSTPWIIHFLDAHAHATGEDLYESAPGLKSSHLYMAHAMLPGGNDGFDFGDMFFGPLSRTGKDEDRARTHPNGRFHTNYNLLYRLANRFKNPDAQGVAAFLKRSQQVNAEDFWSLSWYDATMGATPMAKLPAFHHFTDHDVVYWRTGWDAKATALAFKSGPPEGHHAAEMSRKFPDWHMEAGHAHPDANSFILFSRGQYLTGDSGYAGVPRTDQHNTLLVEGKGQGNEGKGHNAWRDFPYERLNQVRITQVKLTPTRAFIQGDATAGYDPAFGLTRFERNVVVNGSDSILIWDDVESSTPRTFSGLFHSDTSLKTNNDNIEISRGDTKLTISVLVPAVTLLREPNEMTGPGMPGSVASGKTEVRGERVRVSNTSPTTRTRFVYQLKIEGVSAAAPKKAATHTRTK